MSWTERPNLLVDAAVVAAATLVGVALFLLVDLAVGRQLLPPGARPLGEEELPYLIDHATGWYELKPGFEGLDAWGDRRYPVFTDANGFRTDGADARHGPASVVFLGDSFTYGINGPWQETFVGMFAATSGAEVANLGVGSYSPTPYLDRYRHLLATHAAVARHIVVVGLDVSDVQDEASYWMDGNPHPVKRPEALERMRVDVERARIASSGPRGWLGDHLQLTRAVYRYLRYGLGRTGPGGSDPDRIAGAKRAGITWMDWHELDRSPPWEDDSWEGGFAPLGVQGGLDRIEAKLAEIVRLASTDGSRVYVLLYPWPAQVLHSDRFDWSQHVAQLCGRIGCAGVIDTIPEFRRLAQQHSDWYSRYFVVGDCHFNVAGNEVVAKALLERLPATDRSTGQ